MWRGTALMTFDHLSAYQMAESQIEIPLLFAEQPQQASTLYGNQVKKMEDVLNLKKASKSKFLKFCSCMQQKLLPIHPQSVILLIWNLLILFAIFYNFISLPIFLLMTNFYQKGLYDQVFIYIDIGIISLFIIDMAAVRSRIAFYKHQKLVTSYLLIYQKYLSFPFFLDLVTILGYIVFVSIPTQIYLKLFVLFKLYAYFELNSDVQYQLATSPYLLILYKFFRLVAFIVIVTNLAGCIYFAIDYSFYRDQSYYYENSLLWLTGSQTTFEKNLIQLGNWPVWYDYTMYFSVQTIAGCGYGNMTPRNSSQILYCNIIMVTFFAMYIFFESRIYAVFSEFGERSERRQKNMRDYHTYMSQNEVNRKNRKKSKFFMQSYLRRSYEDQLEQDVENLLSQNLKKEMKLTYNNQIYTNMPILKHMFCEETGWTKFAKSAIDYIKIGYLSTGDTIFQSNQTLNFKLILIIRGTIKSVNPLLQNEKIYKQWDYVGQRQFFFQGISTNSAKCLTFTKYYYFQREQFYSLIKQHQEQKQLLRQAFESVYFNGKEGKWFGLECNLCEKAHIQHFCDVCKKWRIRISHFPYKTQQKDHQRRFYDRQALTTKRITNLHSLQSLQIDQHCQYKKYFPIYNLSQPKDLN